jgi:hypothetical protein
VEEAARPSSWKLIDLRVDDFESGSIATRRLDMTRLLGKESLEPSLLKRSLSVRLVGDLCGGICIECINDVYVSDGRWYFVSIAKMICNDVFQRCKIDERRTGCV